MDSATFVMDSATFVYLPFTIYLGM